jgi:hypothetical protein
MFLQRMGELRASPNDFPKTEELPAPMANNPAQAKMEIGGTSDARCGADDAVWFDRDGNNGN